MTIDPNTVGRADWPIRLIRQGSELRRDEVANKDGEPKMLPVPHA